jgi:hypothetical protein
MKDGDRASAEKQHDYLSGLLTGYYKGIIDFSSRNGVVLVAILGWVI